MADALVSVGVLPDRPFVTATDTGDAIRERLAWDLAKAFDTVRGYESYLANFPNGANAAEARPADKGGGAPEKRGRWTDRPAGLTVEQGGLHPWGSGGARQPRRKYQHGLGCTGCGVGG